MASYPTRVFPSFEAAQPIPSAAPLDNEFNQLVGASGVFNGGTSATKLLTKASDGSDPVYEFDQLGAGPIIECKQAGVLKASIDNDGDLTANGITGAAGVYTFSEIPIGPDEDPTDDDEFTRKAYVDGKTTLWAASFWIADIAARGVDANNDDIQRALIPGANFTATHIFLVATAGVNTGAFIVQLIKTPFSGAAGTILGSINYNPAGGGDGGTLGVGIEKAITPHVFTANDFIQNNIAVVAGPQQKSVTVGVKGFQTLV